MTIKEIIQKLHTTMIDARGQESHFESWMTQNEGICDAIDALKALDKQEPVAYIRVSKTGNVMACAKTGDFYKLPDNTLLYTSPQPAPVQEPVAWEQFYPDIGKPKFVAQPEQEPVAWMSEDEREAFERFNETCEDGEGYDVPKTMMRRLAEIGVIHHTSRGIYGITKFGRLLVGNTTQPQRKPMTYEEIEDLYFKFSMGELKDLPETLKQPTELRSKNT